MKESLIKNIHWLIILYAGWGLFGVYEEKEELLNQEVVQLEPARIQLNRSRKKVAEIDKFKENLSASQERVQAVQKSLEKARKQIPADLNDVEVQRELEDLANILKMLDANSSPLEEENRNLYFAKEYRVQARGTYLQFMVFFENLLKKERILNIKEFDLKKGNDEGKSRFKVLNFTAVVESYRYNKDYKEEKEEKVNE